MSKRIRNAVVTVSRSISSSRELNALSPEGGHVGPNRVGGVDEDIPGSTYTVKPTAEQVITISGLEAGAYQVDLIGTSGGAYTLDSVVKQSGQVVSSKTFTGTLVKGQARVTNAVFTAMEGAVTQFMGDLQATPAGLTATSGNETVNLTWTPFNKTGLVVAGYNVYRRTTSGSEYTKIVASPINAPSYRDAGLTNGITYYYVVPHVDKVDSETPCSPEVQATPSLGVSGQNAKIVCGPNPVGAAGFTFFYALPQDATEAQIAIFDVSWRMVFKEWLDSTGERYPATGSWNPTSSDGTPLENGPYVFVVIADGKTVAQGKLNASGESPFPRVPIITGYGFGLVIQNVVGSPIRYGSGHGEPWPRKLIVGISLELFDQAVLAMDVSNERSFHLSFERVPISVEQQGGEQ